MCPTRLPILLGSPSLLKTSWILQDLTRTLQILATLTLFSDVVSYHGNRSPSVQMHIMSSTIIQCSSSHYTYACMGMSYLYCTCTCIWQNICQLGDKLSLVACKPTYPCCETTSIACIDRQLSGMQVLFTNG